MPELPHILLVDDDTDLAGVTKEYLEAKHCTVSVASNAHAGLVLFNQEKFDVCILDVRMPVKDGFALAEEIRQIEAQVPLIFLTGQTKQEDRIHGLTLGADDYITKPFSMQELFLRISVALRRSGFHDRQTSNSIALGKYTFNPASRTLILDHAEAKLSDMESQLLALFCAAQNGLVSRELALRKIWNDEHLMKTRSLNVYINKLRRRLQKDSRIEFLNVYGTGYQLVVRDE